MFGGNSDLDIHRRQLIDEMNENMGNLKINTLMNVMIGLTNAFSSRHWKDGHVLI